VRPPVLSAAAAKAELWHRRMAHLGLDNPTKVHGVRYGRNCTWPSSSLGFVELVHMDVCGPIQEVSHDGHMYIATFLDDYSNMSVVRLLKYKSRMLVVKRQA